MGFEHHAAARSNKMHKRGRSRRARASLEGAVAQPTPKPHGDWLTWVLRWLAKLLQILSRTCRKFDFVLFAKELRANAFEEVRPSLPVTSAIDIGKSAVRWPRPHHIIQEFALRPILQAFSDSCVTGNLDLSKYLEIVSRGGGTDMGWCYTVTSLYSYIGILLYYYICEDHYISILSYYCIVIPWFDVILILHYHNMISLYYYITIL